MSHFFLSFYVGFAFYLRNRFLLTVICCLIYHWLVSREVDISRAQSASDIFTDDCPTTSDILDNKLLVTS